MRPPPEWAPQEWLWIGFPHDAREWPGFLSAAQEQVAVFANAVAETGQEVRLLVRDPANEARARLIVSAAVKLERIRYGDIWLRDTGPITLRGKDGGRRAVRPGFNGWGGKYPLAGDDTVGHELAAGADIPIERPRYVLEGGAIDIDGRGVLVTTEQCLLNPNRNPDLGKGDIETELERDLGAESIVWLGQGLAGDHTDGHVDNLARFVGDGTLVIPQATGADDPNGAVYRDARERAEAAGLTVHAIPSAGRVTRGEAIEPASYVNFCITNDLVVVPFFGLAQDEAAREAIASHFPGRATIGLPATALLAGGGAFHCASMQFPAG